MTQDYETTEVEVMVRAVRFVIRLYSLAESNQLNMKNIGILTRYYCVY